jgi:ankyrin repeat protein
MTARTGLRFLALVSAAATLLACGGDGGAAPTPGSSSLPLLRAAESGSVAEVRRLVAAGADVDQRDVRGRTAITAAAMEEQVEVVDALVDAGADVNLQDAQRNNPLLLAGENGNVALLRAVLRGEPDLRATNRFGGTALIPAADRGHVGMVRALLGTAIPVDHVNRLGWTALLEAVILGDGGRAHQEIVRLLLDAGADVEVADPGGVTALEHARSRGYRAITAILAAERGPR